MAPHTGPKFKKRERRAEEFTEGSIMMNEKKVQLFYPSYLKFRRVVTWANCITFFLSASLFLKTGFALAEKQDFFKSFESCPIMRRWKQLLPPMDSGLSFIYMMAAIWFTTTLISFIGLDGALFTELPSLRRYLCLSSTLFLIFGFDFLAATAHSKMGFKKTRITLFKAYIENHYGVSSFSWIFTSVIDNLQASCHCCGYKSDKSRVAKYRAQQLVLFWSETTQWGLQQASVLKQNQSNKVALVPRSCCKAPDDDKCNLGSHYNRINWSSAIDDDWSNRIYAKSCSNCLDFFNVFYGPGSYFYFTIFFILMALCSIFCVITLYMFKCIQATPNFDVIE